jgi:hypothetical protein
MGADSDWQSGNSGTLWYYGNMDFYGKQQMLNIDYGWKISQHKTQKTSAYIGWNSHKTSNELRNVVYHTIAYTDVGNQTQSDNGSTLDADFQGLHAGLEREQRINDKLTLKAKWTTSYLSTTAHGQWNNHHPAWVWDNIGTTLGQEITLGVNYQFKRDISATVGYRYYHAKMTGGSEVLDIGGPSNIHLNNVIDLRYQQQGIYYAVNAKI